MHDNWWGWLAAFIIFAIVQAWRVLFRASKGAPTDGFKRLNAAAERILKQRGASVANPIPRTHSKGTHAKGTTPMGSTAKVSAAKVGMIQSPRGSAVKTRSGPLPKSTTPAVIRRTGILSGGREQVITRRR
jgi:hypothetical protein